MTSVPSPAPHYPRQDISPWFIRLPLLVLSGVILLMLILTIFLGLFQWRFHDRIVPGVSAFGSDLAGMTPEEAHAMLASKFTYDEDAVFTFRDGESFWQLTAGELDVMFNAQATAVEIELRCTPSAVLLNVRDNGVGITEEQLDDPRSIGLVGIRERAMAFSGRADFNRSPGGGTTVAVELPVRDA